MIAGIICGPAALIVLGLSGLGVATAAMAEDVLACENCGVIRSIRERHGERPVPTAGTAADRRNSLSIKTGPTDLVLVGPVAGFTFGPGQKVESFVGARGGDRMIDSLRETSYDIIVRLDVGGYTTVTEPDASDLRVGDRVRIADGRVQLAP